MRRDTEAGRVKALRAFAQLWSTTGFEARELSSYAEDLMVDETRNGLRTLSLVYFVLLTGALILHVSLGLDRSYAYTGMALLALCLHVYFSARAIRETRTLHVLGMTLLIISGSAFVLVAHRNGDFGVAFFSSVVLLFMVIPMVPWGLREASIVMGLVYGIFSSSTWAVAQRFDSETLTSLQALMLVSAALSMTLVARGTRVRREDICARFELERAKREMEQLSYRDPLTGAWNRRYLELEFEAFAERARKSESGLHFVLLDVDKFKQLNDTRGHVYGDSVLRWVSAAFQQAASDRGHVIRAGGDEFALLLETDTPVAVIEEAMVALRECARRESGDGSPGVSLSAGLVTLPAGARVGLDDAYRAADAALYRAKGAGRGEEAGSLQLVQGFLPRDDGPRSRPKGAG